MPNSLLRTLGATFRDARQRGLQRASLSLAICGAVLLLAGCGGGGDAGGAGNVTLGINAVVGGQAVDTVFVPGPAGRIDLTVGQSIELEANEPVDWAFSVDGSPLFGNGTTVFYNGLAITETAVSPSRVVLETSVTGAYASPVVISMSATSTIDAAEVAAVDLVVH